MPSLADLTEGSVNSVNTPSLLDMVEGSPTRVTVAPMAAPAATGIASTANVAGDNSSNTVERIIDRLFGLNGQERYQLWPEKIARDALNAPHEAATEGLPLPGLRREDLTDIPAPSGPTKDSTALGRMLGIAPVAWEPSDKSIEQAQAMSALAGSGGIGGVPVDTVSRLGTNLRILGKSIGKQVGDDALPSEGVALGSSPFLRPALKYGEKLFKGKEGQQHLDVIPADLYPTFQKQAMNGEDISNFNFGFLNHKGQFLNREDALKYAVDNGLVEPQAAQFGALTSTLMADSSKPGTAIEAMANTNKPFFSAVENAVAGAKQPTADAQQWLGYLKNQPGVKQEELQHLGLDKLQGPISKDDLLKAVQEGQPQIKEVVKGKVDENKVADLENKYAEAQKAYDKLDFNNLKLSEVMAQPETKNLNKAREELEAAKVIPTKYHSYQLPGGENYREMLLTLPEKGSPFQKWYNETHVQSFDNMSPKAQDIVRAKYERETGRSLDDELGNAQQYEQPYKSSHWDEPNVLAHIRMNDRTIDGKKTLHLEEIQSDWHQAGRKNGYKSEADLDKWKDLDKRLTMAREDLAHLSNQHAEKTIGSSYQKFLSTKPDQAAKDEALSKLKQSKQSDDKYIKLENTIKTLEEERNRANPVGKVPDAPFKKTWDELALKKVITEAVKNGYDQISWTPGEAQAARYDLSKQVDRLDLIPAETVHNGNKVNYRIRAVKDGKQVAEHYVKDQNEAASFVGKDVADKLFNSEKNNLGASSLSGDGLKIGGQGMKAFYDKMLVDKANALGKKFGAKIEQKDLNDVGEKFAYINNKSGNKGPAFDTQAEAKEWAKANNINLDNVTLLQVNRRAKEGVSKQPVHVLKLTPELKDHVLKKGFPLFSAGLPIFTPVDYNPFKQKD